MSLRLCWGGEALGGFLGLLAYQCATVGFLQVGFTKIPVAQLVERLPSMHSPGLTPHHGMDHEWWYTYDPSTQETGQRIRSSFSGAQ